MTTAIECELEPLRQRIRELEEGQSKASSLAESVVNTCIGLAIAMNATMLICWVYNIPMSWGSNFIITAWMTVISVGRGYLVRRMWNSKFWRVLSLRAFRVWGKLRAYRYRYWNHS